MYYTLSITTVVGHTHVVIMFQIEHWVTRVIKSVYRKNSMIMYHCNANIIMIVQNLKVKYMLSEYSSSTVIFLYCKMCKNPGKNQVKVAPCKSSWRSKINIGSWNMHGLRRKISEHCYEYKQNDMLFMKMTKELDLIGYLETWYGDENVDEKIEIKGFDTKQIGRPISRNGRFYGGICIAVKEDIVPGTKIIMNKKQSEFVWVKLCKSFFHMEKDIYICFLYVCPERPGSEYNSDVLDAVEADIVKYSSTASCFILGDLNGSTGTDRDHIHQDEYGNELIKVPANYIEDEYLNRRRNQDIRSVTERGRQILDFCSSTGLRILNGRKIGDLLGKPTYFGPRNKHPTTIDYGLAPADSLGDVVSFRVSDFTHLSDHCLIQMSLNAGYCAKDGRVKEYGKLKPHIQRYIWDDSRVDLFTEKLMDSESSVNISNFIETTIGNDITDVDSATHNISDIIITAADKTFRKSKLNSKSKPKKYPKYIDGQCRRVIISLKKMTREISKHPYNPILRHNYYVTKRALKKMIKQNEILFKNNLISKLSLNGSDYREFWKIIQDLDENVNGRKQEPNTINVNKWLEHFKNLMNRKLDLSQGHHKKVLDFINEKGNWEIFNELSYKITGKELLDTLRGLKNNKSCGTDKISNEMLKTACPILTDAVLKLFNHVLLSGIFPTEWRLSLLKPLHKGGNTDDPNRYRGISIVSCLGKLFCSVLNGRLSKFVSEHKLNSIYQSGFTPGCRTTDNILVLKTIFDKYIEDKKNVYVCFVDFRKAFDSVWREGLAYKLLKKNIGGPFGKLLYNICSNTNVALKLKEGISDTFSSNIGVKQGCVLSPNIFNIFISDLPEYVNKPENEPVTLFREAVNCLLFADDVVLISESAKGLQGCIDSLTKFVDDWLLEIHPDKTKVMVFNKTGKLLNKNKFTYRGHQLELVKSYTYLGIQMALNGNFSNAITTLSNKARKALFRVKNSLIKTNITPDLSLHIYDTLIRPISTYGCDVWGAYFKDVNKMFDINYEHYNIFDKLPFEKLNLKYCKFILGVNSKASNAATRGELGRYPVIIYVIKQVIKNWLRMSEDKKNVILYDTYLCALDLLANNKISYFSNLRPLCHKIGLKFAWENQGASKVVNTCDTAVKSMQHIHNFQWANTLNRPFGINGNKEGNKLRTYKLFKKEFEFEKYLLHIKDWTLRRNLTKLRISAHNLYIEKLRYSYPKIPVKDRLCDTCKVIEDEQHVVMYCTRFEASRSRLLKDINEIYVNFTEYNNIEQFQFVMKLKDSEICSLMSTFMKEIINTRGFL